MENHLFPIGYKEKYIKELNLIDKYISNLSNWDYPRVTPPFIYELGGTNKIHYFGTAHIMNKSEPLIEILKKDFHNFSDKQTEFIVLVEDWEHVVFENEDEALEKKGERGLLMYWAKNLGNIEVIPTDFDHPKNELLSVLAKEFAYDDIVLFTFLYFVKLRNVHKWAEKENVEGYIEEKLNSHLEVANIKPTNFMHLGKLHEAKFKEKVVDRANISVWEDLDIKKPDNGVNVIFRKYHTLRDRNFLYQIIANYNEGKNVYAIYGCDHAQFHKPVLEEILRII